MRAFVDTNVVVYAFDRGEPRKQARARELLAGRMTTDLVVSTQVLQEFYVATTTRLRPPVDPADAASAVARLALLPVVSIDPGLVQAAIETSRSNRVSLWDALVIEAARVANADVLLTEDLNDGQDGVRVVDPFRQGHVPGG